MLPPVFEICLLCRLSAGIHFIAVGSGLFFTAASGKKPCLAHCRSFRRSLPKRKIFAVWTDLETWPWLSRCASLAMPANDEGKLIAYKWRKSAILETPEQIFFRGETHAAHLARHPSPIHGKIGQIDTASGKFFQHVIHHLMSKIGPFGNLFRKIFSNCFARVSTVIDHPCESCQHHLLSAGPYCSLSLYVKIEAEWKHFLKIF